MSYYAQDLVHYEQQEKQKKYYEQLNQIGSKEFKRLSEESAQVKRDKNFIEKNKERISLVSAGTKAFNMLKAPLKTTLTQMVFDNSLQVNPMQDKLIEKLKAKIQEEQRVNDDIRTIEQLYENLLEQSDT